jgi:hypothetical protein
VLITYQDSIKFRGFNDFKIFVKKVYNSQWGLISYDDALNILYSKKLNEFFQFFVNTSSDFDEISYWRDSKNFIW